MNVIKRNGSIEPFDKNKIFKAIMKAAIGGEIEDFENEALMITDDIDKMLADSEQSIVHIEEIQDLIEIDLYSIANDPRIAKSFILFREKRKQERDKNTRYAEIIRSRALKPEDANQKANANLDENSFSGRMYEASEDLWKEIGLSDFMTEELSDLHKAGVLYMHDLARFALGQHNCLSVDMEPLLRDGFITRHVTLRSPSKFATACQQVAVIFQILSQHQFGGIASGHIDRDLAPYVDRSIQKINDKYAKYGDGLVEREIENELKQGAEALIHNLATLQSRPGAQLPFSSLNLGADVSNGGRLACRAILQAMINGVGPNHTTPPFPILCFQLKKGVNMRPEDPNYDLKLLAIECATKRLTPNFVNLDVSTAHSDENNPDTWATSMGCRTQMGYDRFNKEDPYNRIGRGNLAPHTINPVPLGIKYGICLDERNIPDLKGFEKEFDYLLQKAEESLIIRAQLIFSQKMKVAYEMYVNKAWKTDIEYDDEKSVYDVLKHGTFVIGSVGWAETLVALFGKHQGESQEASDFLLKMQLKMQAFCGEASDRNNLNFVNYHTPAENVVYTLMKKMKKQFGIIPGVTEHEYLTNSIHIPVWHECGIFEKLKKEGEFAKLAGAGNIVYVELDSVANSNLEAVEQIIDFAMEQDIPYFAFNFPLDECTVCGYSGEISPDGCPECAAPDEAINRLRRVTGYITSDYRRAFNHGKQIEVQERTKHSQNTEVKIIE